MTTSRLQYGGSSSGGIAVVIPAAGTGSRMKDSLPKQFHLLEGRPLLIHTITPFLLETKITEVIVVAAEECLEKTRELCRSAFPEEKRLRFVCGGARRQDSVFAGLQAAKAELLMVHDGARPMVTSAIIKRCCRALEEGLAFITAIPVVDTIKRVEGGLVQTTLDRSDLFRAQTPQGAPGTVLIAAFRQFLQHDLTDEAALLEKAGVRVHLVEGEESNIKITRREDLRLAASLLSGRKSEVVPQRAAQKTFPRIGHGIDAHRLVTGRKLILGGVDIPFARGLAGHSDADVLTHALCDALLGAACEGDIGKIFPDTDQRFKDICSLSLLTEVAERVESKGLRLENADVTIVCQQPKIAPHISEMKQNLCKSWAHLPGWPAPDRLNIKATTEENMGYTGRQEGIRCHAVALVFPSDSGMTHL